MPPTESESSDSVRPRSLTKHEREAAILKAVYDTRDFDTVTHLDRPDFILGHNSGVSFGVEITEVHRSETDARVTYRPSYLDDLFAFPIARDGVALIVHRDNPVRGLTAQQAIGIFTGKITNWKALGGRDAAVTLIWRAKGQGSVELLSEHLNFSHADVRAHATIVENEAVIREVEANPNAIAPVSLGDSESKAQAGARIKLLAFVGTPASSKTIRNGSYALARPLALVTRRLPDGLGKRFIDFALSGHVADLFAKHAFVPYQE